MVQNVNLRSRLTKLNKEDQALYILYNTIREREANDFGDTLDEGDLINENRVDNLSNLLNQQFASDSL